MRLEIGSGKAASQAIFKKVEADVAVGELVVDELVVGDMRKLKTEWHECYMKVLMKLEVIKLAEAKSTTGDTDTVPLAVYNAETTKDFTSAVCNF